MHKIHLQYTASMREERIPEAIQTTGDTDPIIASASQQRYATDKRLILVIDDSNTVRKILETCLGREGFEVKSFPDGIAAMKWLSQSDTRIPLLIFLDICLPFLNGYEVARTLKAKKPFDQIVIIMLSRRDGILDRLKGRLVGANDYLTKPFQTHTILAIVASYGGLLLEGVS